MERKVFWCLDCHAIFDDGENCRCKKVYKSSFLSKLGIGNKHAEGIHGSILQVSQYNVVGPTQCLNYPVAFSSSTNVESKLNAKYLQNFRDSANAYMKAQQEERRDIPVIKTSTENMIFDLSFHPRHQVSIKGNDENCLASDCFVGEQYHTSDTRQETTNYSTVSGVSSQALELQNDNIESSITKSIVHNYMLTPILYGQEGFQASSFSGGTTSKKYCSTTGFLFFNTDSCRPDSHEGRNNRNNVPSTNIPEPNYISKNFDFLPMQRVEAPHLQSSLQVITQTGDMGANKLADNNVSLVSESDENPIAGSSHRNVENYYEFKDGRFICILCKKSYTVKHNLIVHFRSHTGEKPFACDKCPETFIDKKRLNIHYKIHFDESPFPCDMCEKRFFSQVDLDKHQLIHSSERPYACDKCPNRFNERKQLDVHLRIHTGERPFSCHMCDKRFITQAHLTTHLRTHSGVKTFPCDICDRSFTKKDYLDRHRQTHFGN